MRKLPRDGFKQRIDVQAETRPMRNDLMNMPQMMHSSSCTKKPDCKCSDCIAYDESSPL